MKIVIDFDDEKLKSQIESVIDQRIQSITAERLESLIEPVISKKLERMDDNYLTSKLESKLDEFIHRYTVRDNYNELSFIESIISRTVTNYLKGRFEEVKK